MYFYRICGLFFIASLFAFKSMAIRATDNLTDKERFYLAALFFGVDDDDNNLQTLLPNHYGEDWVKPMLFSLATSGNNDVAPELCRNYFPEHLEVFIDRYNLRTDLAVLRAGETAKLMLEQHEEMPQSLIIEMTMLISRLEHIDVLTAEAKKLAENDTSDLKDRLAIMLSKKREYGGYCETSRSWGLRSMRSESAPECLRKGPKGLLRFFLAQLKVLATNARMMDEYNGFVNRMQVLDIDTMVDIEQDPWEVLEQDIKNEARELKAYDIVTSPRLPARSEEQLLVQSLIKEIQRYNAFIGIIETWSMKIEGMNASLGFCGESYYRYLKNELDDRLYPRLHEYRGGFSKGYNSWVLDSLIFAMSVRPDIAPLIDHINDVKYVYPMDMQKLKEYVKELIHEKFNWSSDELLERQVKLRWLKNISVQMGLEKQYSAMIVYLELEDQAPPNDDNQDIYEWIQNYIETNGSADR